jgi:hypothetical protein
MEEGNVLIDQMTFPAVPTDRSYGRGRDGEKGFRIWRDPTPGDKNLPKIPDEFLRPKDGGAPEGEDGSVLPPEEPGRGEAERRREGAERDD